MWQHDQSATPVLGPVQPPAQFTPSAVPTDPSVRAMLSTGEPATIGKGLVIGAISPDQIPWLSMAASKAASTSRATG